MVDIALIIVAIVTPFVLVFLNVVILAKYVDPQHASGHYLSKFIVVFGLLLAECAILLLPLDVGNRAGVVGCGFWNSECGGLDLSLVWQIVYLAIAVMVVVIIPFAIFYYEADDEGMSAASSGRGCCGRLFHCGNCRRALCSAICYETITLVISITVLVTLWSLVGKARIPVRATTVDVNTVAFFNVHTHTIVRSDFCGTGSCNFSDEILEIDVTFVIYLAALLAFVGWFLFTIYTGIGLIGLPLDLINAFRHRPKVLTKVEMLAARKMLNTKADDLIREGERIGNRMIDFDDSSSHSRSERKKHKKSSKSDINRYKVLVDALERELEEFEECNPENFRENYNPLVPWGKLFLGILSCLISFLWIVHIVLYMLLDPPVSTFLNKYLIFFDKWFPLFGTLSVGLFSMYLLFAAAKGNFKFGTRFFLIEVHPMEMGKTLMNSFLFNIGLILLCVLPVVQFSTDAFDTYARLTDADLIFGSIMRYIEGFRYLWEYNIFLYAILGFAFLSLIYFSCFPSDKDHVQALMDSIKHKKKQERRTIDTRLKARGGALEGTELTEWRSGRK